MTIKLYVEKLVLEFFHLFIKGEYPASNGTPIRGRWHLGRDTDAELVEVSVTYDDYIRLADNE